MDSSNLGNNKLPNIIVTGTPGVGKTSMAMLLVDRLNESLQELSPNSRNSFQYVNVGKLISDKKLYTSWNEEYDVPEFDEEKIVAELASTVETGGCVLDFHSAYFFPEEWADLVVLLRCNNTVLFDRLSERGYSEKKIKENIECEIMEVTADDVKENFDPKVILELSNEKIEDMEKNIESIISRIMNK
jgi:adenylate kinase